MCTFFKITLILIVNEEAQSHVSIVTLSFIITVPLFILNYFQIIEHMLSRSFLSVVPKDDGPLLYNTSYVHSEILKKENNSNCRLVLL